MDFIALIEEFFKLAGKVLKGGSVKGFVILLSGILVLGLALYGVLEVVATVLQHAHIIQQ